MRKFNYTNLCTSLLTPEITGLLSLIHEYKGKQDLYINAQKDILNSLLEIAKIQSTDASNRIEGIFTSEARLKELIKNNATPQNRNEKEIAGYRDVLATIHENYDYIPISPNTLLQLHRDLYSYLAVGTGGNWKSTDNIIAEIKSDGQQFIRFKPVSAFETPEAIQQLCNAYNTAISEEIHDPLLLDVLFIFDFLCIHPFNDGNGRMSRILTLLLLYKHGYIVGKYISIEKFIEISKQTYYETLYASSNKWSESDNDYIPFVTYYLGVILKTYREFENRIANVFTSKINKSERIKLLFDQKLGKISKREILEICPDISIAKVEMTLKSLLDSNYIRKVGVGRSTAYVKN